MSNALLSGVSGLKAHQGMLDVAGNNLANVNTTSFKSSRVTFAELLSQTLRAASQPTANTGGTNPMQVGSGVQIASVDRNMAQGSLINTGQPLDMAVEGAGYFVLNDGQKEVYTRVGAFAVDADYYLVNPGTGYRVQRIGSEGQAEGFQDATSSDIRIPYDVALPAKSTETITYAGQLQSDLIDPSIHVLGSGIQYRLGGGPAAADSLLSGLDQASGLADGDQIAITGTDRSGNPVNQTFTITAATSTLGDLLTAISNAFPGSTATISDGRIIVTDDQSGYSQTDLLLSYTGGGSLELPSYFLVHSAGGQLVQTTNIEIFDSQGAGHTLTAAFVRTDTPLTWDLVLTSLSGDIQQLVDRRVKGISFLTTGAYGGMAGTPSDAASFQVRFGHDPANTRTINLDFGTIGEFDGLSQFGGASTAAASGQDGYASGSLLSVSVTREAVLVGVFTNGIRRDLAAMKLATFQNPAGLESIGNSYFVNSTNSGDPVPTKALAGGAGAVRGGALEKSNVEVAAEFVNLIQAQNGFQANARTIRVANEMLRELTNLIR